MGKRRPSHQLTHDAPERLTGTHGTVFRRAFEEGLLIEDHSVHVGIRGPIYVEQDLADDRRFGFRTIRTSDVDDQASAARSRRSSPGSVTSPSTCPSTSTSSTRR